MTSLTTSDHRLPDEHSFRYEHCDIPEGMTLTEWRRSVSGPPRRRRGLFGWR